MKKLLLPLLLAAASMIFSPAISHAQSGYFKRASDSRTTDTLTDAGTSNLQLPISGFQKVVTIQPKLVKKTGTASATVLLWGSTDGVDYVRCPSRRTDGTYKLDTLLVTNVAGTQTKGFIVENSPYAYYRISSTGAGTQSTQVRVFAIWRKE